MRKQNCQLLSKDESTKAAKKRGPHSGDLILSEMTPAIRRKLTPALVSLCPNCKERFVQQGYPRIYCSKNCRQNTWKRQHAKYLEAGRKAVTEMVAQGMVDLGEAEIEDRDWIAELFSELFPDSETYMVDCLIERAGKSPRRP
jgi:hypothetical protein